MTPGRRRSARGQASVELALVLPVLAVAALLLVEVGLAVKDTVLLVHAGREALRAAVVEPTPQAVQRAVAGTTGLARDRLVVTLQRSGDRVTVTISYRRVPNVQFLRGKFPEFRPRVQVTGHVED